MLSIRLQRIGKKHQPSYRIVVAEAKSKMKAPPVEDLGSYSTLTKKATLNKDRVAYWLSKGAKASPTVHNIFVAHNAVSAPKVKIHIVKKASAAAPAAEAVAA